MPSLQSNLTLVKQGSLITHLWLSKTPNILVLLLATKAKVSMMRLNLEVMITMEAI